MVRLFAKRLPVLSVAVLLTMTASSADALVINNYFTYDLKNHERAIEIIDAVNYSSRAFENLFSNDVTVNIQYQLDYSVGVGLGRAAGGSERIRKDVYGDLLIASSAANPENAVLAKAVESLGQGNFANPGIEYIEVTSAQIRAIGVPIQGDVETWGNGEWYSDFGGDSLPEGQGLDGSVILMSVSEMLFGMDIPAYDKSIVGAPVRFSAINTIQHEIMHILGGGNSIIEVYEDDLQELRVTKQVTPLDLYRYTAPGKPHDGGATDFAYFSVDGGKTNIQQFNTGDRWEAGGWGPMAPCPSGIGRGGPIGLFMDAASCSNQPTVTVSLDSPEGIQLMALGWNPRVAAVPEPATWTMMLLGFGGIGAALRRRRPRAAACIAAT